MAAAAMQQQNITTDGLKLHFDANDKTSYNNGTSWCDMKAERTGSHDHSWEMTNGANFDNSTFGFGTMHFDGSDDYVTGDNDHLDDICHQDNRPHNGFSFDAWINISAYGASTANEYWQSAIISKGNVYFNFGVRHNGYLKLYYYTGTVHYVLANTTVLGLDRWRHVAMTVNSNLGVALYVDGEAETLSGGTTTNYSNLHGTGVTQAAEIGTADYNQGSTNNFNGYISILRQYDRGLLASEIKHNFNAQRHRFGV